MKRLFDIAAVVLVALLAFGVYKAKTEADAARAKAAALAARAAEEAQAVRALEAEISRLEDPRRLEALARDKLGMRPIDPLRVVTLEEAPLLMGDATAPPGARLSRQDRPTVARASAEAPAAEEPQ